MATCMEDGGEIRVVVQKEEEGLCFGVAEADVVLEDLGACGGEDEACEEEADEGVTWGGRQWGGRRKEERADRRDACRRWWDAGCRCGCVPRCRGLRREQEHRRPCRRCWGLCRPGRCACGPGQGAGERWSSRPRRRGGRVLGRGGTPR